MEAKFNLQMETYNAIYKARKNYKKSPKERITESYVQVRLETLEKLWSDFVLTHRYLIENFSQQIREHEYTTKDIYDQTDELYTEYKTELKTVLNYYINNRESTRKDPPKDTSKNSQIKLPKIVLPTFSGKYNEWVTFRDLFTSLVHANPSLDDVQKLYHLKLSISGEAERLLRQIPTAEANYSKCWEKIKSRFDNKRYLSHHILKTLLSQKNITAESSSGLKDLLDTTNDCLHALQNIGVNVDNWDIIIIHILCLKLDLESRKQWELSITNETTSEELPTFKQFETFLTGRFRALEFLDTKSQGNKNFNQSANANSNINKVKSMHTTNVSCAFCSESHKLNTCRKFVKETVDQRRDFVLTHAVCFNCLGLNHIAKDCTSKARCKLCSRQHHTLLHPRGTDSQGSSGAKVGQEQKNGAPEGAGPSQAGENTERAAAHVASCFSTGVVNKQVLLATALVTAKSRTGGNHILRVLLDQGSQANFVTESTVQDLKLKKVSIRSQISGVGSDDALTSNAKVSLKIQSRVNPDDVVTIEAYVLRAITTFLPNKKVELIDWPELREIELADPTYYQPNKIDVLLGADVYSQVLQAGIKKGPSGSIVAQSTSLGWVLSGGINSSHVTNRVLALHCQIQEDNEFLKKFWEMESDVGFKKEQMFTEEEKRCEELFTKTTSRNKEGRYVVRLPFKDDDPDCKRGNSRMIAEKRLKGLETRLRKDENLKQTYKEVIEEYLELGHMEQIQEPDRNRNEAVYLPHHAVVRDDKDTTKVRVVFNASSKGTNAVSLNDSLMVGPTIQPELRHLVMRWRTYNICMSADIVKMYRQVVVHEDDTNFQRLLWRDDPKAEIKDFKITRVTFGMACAPFLAVRALVQTANDEGGKFPLAAEIVRNEFYMDDLMTGCETVKEGEEIFRQTNSLLNQAGFVLQKWTSNSDELLKKIQEENENQLHKDRIEMDVTQEGINIKTDKVMKILGLTWERSEDNFRYSVKLPEMGKPITKRKVISDITRLFDPLGWITPSIIVAKVLIQKLWISGVDWDEEIPKNILDEWCIYRAELAELQKVVIPRWIGTKSKDAIRELHGFSDASKTAYAAVVYIRVVDSDGNIHVSLVTAKSKVAPIKQVSIPRLELCGAVLVTRLLLEVQRILNIDHSNIHAWTDSTIVLSWLNSLPNKWKVFVANRVSEILTSLNPEQWSHVSSKNNPADCASRGVLPSELHKQSLWFKGPEFLSAKNIIYSKPKDMGTDLEAVTVHHVVTQSSNEWEKFSTLTRLIRVIAYCRRFLQVRKPKVERKKGYLETEELREAMEICIRKVQEENFEEELNDLKKKKEIKRKSCLKALNPFLDQAGVLRVGGRLEEAKLTSNQKHPILLPRKSHLTNLIIADAHRQTLHGGTKLTLSYVCNKYFVLGAKQLVKAYIRKCVICVKTAGKTFNQLMGQLPLVRVTPSRPFRASGVDFAGPIQIRTAKGRGHKSHKGYICLFICMATRAIHVEAVTDLTTEGFLQAFKRFVARRGHCAEVWSDNGTNFVGAAAELKKLFSAEKDSLLPEIAESLATNGTSWHFIPPHAPNFGGLWEAGIKSVKTHLKKVIGSSTLTFEEVSTVLAQVEACLNSRPLSRLNGDENVEDILTPGHFLIGEALVSPPDHNFETSNVTSLRRWQYTQRILQDFWRRWSQEYLRRFFHRYRWASSTPQPKPGDVVLIKEDGLPPCRWLYGLITEDHPGKDGITRVVTVKTRNSSVKRPTSKICVLPIEK